MPFGYTIFDPIFVVSGSLLALWLLVREPRRLMLFLPAALSIYSFIPVVSLLTLAEIVPILVLIVMPFRGGLEIPQRFKPGVIILVTLMALQVAVALGAGDTDPKLVLTRCLYYVGMLALFLFSLQACREEEAYQLLVRGAAIAASIHAAYGLYQLAAVPLGLPVRGILRGVDQVQLASEGFLFRINGLASEPKRLGYVLAIGALALLELAAQSEDRAGRWLRRSGLGVMAISLLTLSGSYLLALALSAGAVTLLFPRFLKLMTVFVLLVAGATLVFPGVAARVGDVLEAGLDRRLEEVDRRLSGARVYRQEFYAEEYLTRHPERVLLGVGIGRSNAAFLAEFGNGAGYDGTFRLPLNSQALQIVLDLGGPALLIVYWLLGGLVLRARRLRDLFLLLVLLLLGAQSLSILVLPFLVVFMGAAAARLEDQDLREPLATGLAT